MTGKTHMSIGVGTATLLMHTKDVKIIIGGTILVLVGSLIVDIDCKKSKGSKLLKELFASAIIITLLGVFLHSKSNVNILIYITGNKSLLQMVPAVLLLTTMIIIGKFSSHRSFTHSIIGIMGFTAPIYMLVGTLYSWFLIGFMTHIFADILTKEKVRILYPVDSKGKYGICLNICNSNGIVDKSLFFVFLFITVSSNVNIFHPQLATLFK